MAVKNLVERAKTSEDKESFKVAKENRNFRIGIGARLEPKNQPTFFIEILVNLCADQSEINLDLLEKKMDLLKDLRKKDTL